MNRPQESIIGNSAALALALDRISQLAPINRPVLVVGERGTGKELAADRLHYLSGRWDAPLLKVNCAAIAEPLLESERFGHEPGAFTGATKTQRGRFERADGGTLFLDELATMSLRLQEKLLRLVEYGEFERLGGQKTLQVDVRVVAATNADLSMAMADGSFRADLYYRIAGISITIPPLRERRGDITSLVKAMLDKTRTPNGDAARITEDALEILQNYDYPGNIRELHNLLQKAVAVSTNGLVTKDQLQLNDFSNIYINPLADRRRNDRSNGKSSSPSTNRSLTDVEATHIESLLHQHDGHRAKVAEELRISERTLYRKLKQYNLQDVGKNRN